MHVLGEVEGTGFSDLGGDAVRPSRGRERRLVDVARAAGHPTGVALISVAEGGENCIVVVAGANALVSRSQVAAQATAFTHAKVVVSQLETPVEAATAAFELARRAGALTVLNAAPASSALPHELLSLVDWLVVNESEAQVLARAAAAGPGPERDAARRLLDSGVGAVIVTQLQKPIDAQDAVRQTVKFCLFATGLVVTVTAIILASTNLPKEIENRVIYTIVTKPTTRLEIVVGKVLGFARVSAAILLIIVQPRLFFPVLAALYAISGPLGWLVRRVRPPAPEAEAGAGADEPQESTP